MQNREEVAQRLVQMTSINKGATHPCCVDAERQRPRQERDRRREKEERRTRLKTLRCLSHKPKALSHHQSAFAARQANSHTPPADESCKRNTNSMLASNFFAALCFCPPLPRSDWICSSIVTISTSLTRTHQNARACAGVPVCFNIKVRKAHD